MPDPLDSISPFSLTKSKTHPQDQSQNDTDIDKFANLFNPQTPPASPTLPPIFSESRPTSSFRSGNLPNRRTHVRQASTGAFASGDSEFGSFVSVPPNQDPLSELSFPALPPALTLFPSLEPSVESETVDSIVSLSSDFIGAPISRSGCSQSHTHNPSLSFFSKFTEDAKARGEKGKEYLNELLQHEDDPLYWVKSDVDDRDARQHTHGIEPALDHGRMDQEMSGIIGIDGVTSRQEASASDPDGNSIFHSMTNTKNDDLEQPSVPNDQSHRAKQFSTPSLTAPFPISQSPRLPHLPSRPTSTVPSTSASSGTTNPSAPQIVRSSSSSSVPLSTSLVPSQYHNSLTTGSRWMSSLISTSRPSAPSTSGDTPPPLQSIFTPRSTSSDDLPHPHPRLQHPKTQNSLATSPHTTAISILKPHHSHTIPLSSSYFTTGTASSFIPSSASTISHGTPFASRPYVPPSGAPGFAGDHVWDKGFSNDFDKDRVEKRSVSLQGRKGTTSPVLEQRLAGLIRSYLPALARLPHTWNLLYSLDQHGISLNTLYARCEPQGPTTSHSKGALVVIKDSKDAVFGAWMGEGLKLNKGSYYGSGESFLWKYVGGSLKVFKWTGKNDYVALCESEYLSFGGGDGHYGLYVDDTLLDGSSARCPTFDNEPLCSIGTNKCEAASFECVGLEVWGVGPT